MKVTLTNLEPILIDSTKINLYETIGIETRLLVESLGEALFETNTLETSLIVFYDEKCKLKLNFYTNKNKSRFDLYFFNTIITQPKANISNTSIKIIQ